MISSKFIYPLILTLAISGLSACSKKGPAEETGKAIDSKFKEISEEVEKNSEEVGIYIDDAIITVNAKAALLADFDLKSLGITVETLDGVSTLKGDVSSSAEKDKAGTLVKGVHGVKDVTNDLEVKPSK